MRKKTLFAANAVIALLLALFFFQTVGRGVPNILAKVSWQFVLIGALFYAAMNVVTSVRLAWLLKQPWSASIFFKHMTAMLLGDFTPGRVGYSSIVLKLRSLGIEGGVAAKTVGVVFASDFIGRSLLALAAILFFTAIIDSTPLMVLAVAMLSVGVTILYALCCRSLLLANALQAIPFFGARLKRAYETALIFKAPPTVIAGNVGLSLFGALLRGIAWTFTFFALGIDDGFGAVLPATLVSALATAISFIPVSIAGVGVQEGVGAYLFSIVGIATVEQAAAVVVLVRFIEFGTNAAFGWKELLVNWKNVRQR